MRSKKRLFHTAAMLATSVAAFGPQMQAKESTAKQNKKLRPTAERLGAHSRAVANAGPEPPARKKRPAEEQAATPKRPVPLESALTVPLTAAADPNWIVPSGGKFPWKTGIVTTTFWIGEDAAPNNPVANYASSWDPVWSKNFGGLDTPKRDQRDCYLPAAFVPQQNPFYVALPYNDVSKGHHKPEAAGVIPWFNDAFEKDGKTVLKDRWIAIRFKDRIAYAQWEDCGPFRTDHAAYVFGTERPKPNLNKGAGLDVSPAVRDYLGMGDTDVTDWRFVEFDEVPHGPWATHGENNTFVLKEREKQPRVVLSEQIAPGAQRTRTN
jgi:hypothetical protein